MGLDRVDLDPRTAAGSKPVYGPICIRGEANSKAMMVALVSPAAPAW